MVSLEKVSKTSATALYLTSYTMEAVAFMEFMYEEAVQQGIQTLRSAKKTLSARDLQYLAGKFENLILNPALAAHRQWGHLNPYLYPAIEDFYTKALNDYYEIIKTP